MRIYVFCGATLQSVQIIAIGANHCAATTIIEFLNLVRSRRATTTTTLHLEPPYHLRQLMCTFATGVIGGIDYENKPSNLSTTFPI